MRVVLCNGRLMLCKGGYTHTHTVQAAIALAHAPPGIATEGGGEGENETETEVVARGQPGAGKESEVVFEVFFHVFFFHSFRISKSWDVAPRGFEHISPLQYKAMQGIALHCC